MAMTMLPTETHKFYVDFEMRPHEDRNASIAAGHPVFVDVEYAIITMPGGSLVVDKIVTDELLYEWKHGGRGKPPSKFALNAYEAWKEGREAPLEGTDLRNWPGVTPAQLKTCIAANIKTVEDLATANAEGTKRLGMGGVALVQKAKAYLENANDNKASEAISALKTEVEALMKALDKKDAQINELMEQLTEPDQPKRTRRKRNPETRELE